MRFHSFSLAFAALLAGSVCFVTPAAAQEEKGTQRKAPVPTSGLNEEDDDLLDEDLDGDIDAGSGDAKNQLPPGMVVPPADEKARIDARVAELAARSDAIGDELFEELVQMENSNAEVERRVVEAKQRHKSLTAKIDKLTEEVKSGGKAKKEPRPGYGQAVAIVPQGNSPLARYRDNRGMRSFDPRGYDPNRPLPPDPRGQQQLKWWQQLLITLAQGIMDTLKDLAEARTNSLKAESDALSLSTDAKYRPYVNASVRRAVGNSSLGRNAARRSDPRLNDLNFRRTPTVAKKTNTRRVQPTRRYTTNNSNSATFKPGPVKVELLPRVRDPITGREKPIVNLPLGAAPLRRR
jgi:hypothetical protein